MVSRKNLKYFDLETILVRFIYFESYISICTSDCRAPASELVLQKVILESKIVYRRVAADFEKPKKCFRSITNRASWNVEKSGFQKKFEIF